MGVGDNSPVKSLSFIKCALVPKPNFNFAAKSYSTGESTPTSSVSQTSETMEGENNTDVDMTGGENPLNEGQLGMLLSNVTNLLHFGHVPWLLCLTSYCSF